MRSRRTAGVWPGGEWAAWILSSRRSCLRSEWHSWVDGAQAWLPRPSNDARHGNQTEPLSLQDTVPYQSSSQRLEPGHLTDTVQLPACPTDSHRLDGRRVSICFQPTAARRGGHPTRRPAATAVRLKAPTCRHGPLLLAHALVLRDAQHAIAQEPVTVVSDRRRRANQALRPPLVLLPSGSREPLVPRSCVCRNAACQPMLRGCRRRV